MDARRVAGTAGLALATLVAGCASNARPSVTPEARVEAIARAQVWRPVATASLDLRRGPGGPRAFAPDQLVTCTYVEREHAGNTPKFDCVRPGGDEVRVKYGRDNGEVYAEVAATRLLWALGFGADAMYPVRVRCTGCPDDDGKPPADPTRVRTFDIAAIERKMPGRDLDASTDGWSWQELDKVDPRRGGAPLAHRDALKLLAAMLQHTDSKKEQQRLLCLDQGSRRARDGATCRQPFMMISDLGKTFGTANAFNRDAPGSVNLEAWQGTKVWEGERGCRAHLDRSITGSLESPAISDAGRRFLADRLRLISDAQLTALFTVARFPARAQPGAPPGSPGADAAAWVAAFKDKVRQIAEQSCVLGPGGQ